MKLERFIINSDHISYQELMSIISNSLNKRPPSIKLKPWMMQIFISLNILWNKIRGNRIELSTDAIKYTKQEILLNTDKINSTMKHDYIDIKDSLTEYVDIFIKETLLG